ncbi:bifunctional demethylmenaquinone methyltransferase/2-methoxy-6-polyprenyl-1,4-benzoquinol methylase UbiE [Leptolyngbya sp. 15MV]|nr:bifunctional demethylmenaquinone methyltransferase/2-methoxy-6-polyprenyl-1,4-benzoquinol methylase UbiE [Leptolyngbya sp. 15MV]
MTVTSRSAGQNQRPDHLDSPMAGPQQVTTSDAPQPGSVPEVPAGWSDADLDQPHRHAAKAQKVRGMFAAIARSYDLNNRLHSLGRDQAWRRFAVRRADPKPSDVCVDVACGTGDLTELLAASGARSVIGIDFTPQMLDIAREKLATRPEALRGRTVYREGDAMALDLPDASADVVTIAFGIRNVTEPARALAEFARVLRPGGRLVVLEFDTPRLAPLRWFNALYCAKVMPRTATWISRDRSGAYRYLPKSVETFMSRDEMVAAMGRAGFGDVSAVPLTFGICVCYFGVRRG